MAGFVVGYPRDRFMGVQFSIGEGEVRGRGVSRGPDGTQRRT